MPKLLFTSAYVCAMLASTFAQAQQAERFPVKSVRLIVPFPPGGSNDILGRFIGQKLSERLGQQTVIDNRGGADGIIGTEIAAKSPADGYTLLIVSTSYAMNTAIHKLPYDPLRSLTGISLIGTGANVLTSHPSLPAKNIKELITFAKKRPGQLRYASSGIGGFNHFGGELFKAMAGVDFVHVPYKGGGPAMIEVMGGQVELLFSTLIQALPHVRSGKMRALGVGSEARTPLLPEVQTIAEGGVAGYDGSIWWGLLAPAGLPPATLNRLHTEITAILRDTETTKRLQSEAAEPAIASAEEFNKLIARDIAKWQKVAKQSGIKAH